jgi:Protein of unknown function (DUF4199)
MKKTILTFGVISGVISSVLMFAHMSFFDQIGWDKGMVVGYTGIVLSFLLVFFGIRSYRDNVNGGTISFSKAFTVGILITLISCVFYVVTWEIIYFKIMPDVGEKMTNQMVEQVRNSGASPSEVAAQLEQTRTFLEWYKNPFINAAITFLEPFPVGLIVTLISAAILRKKPDEPSTEQAVAATT